LTEKTLKTLLISLNSSFVMENTEPNAIEYISIVVSTILFIWFFIWLYFLLPRKMARKRGRSVLGWTLLFWFISPIWGIILLLILGDSKEKFREDIMKELNRN
jgi:threonine/homoserine/homoserine lactone efflux protein